MKFGRNYDSYKKKEEKLQTNTLSLPRNLKKNIYFRIRGCSKYEVC